ncbi:MAG TPA: ATP-binding protein [Anaeromyxobacter sp.]|nr:ATP-binding protein [Anaeromyxobacter sp.]
MSLRLQLTLLFGAVLIVTMAVAATLGASTARRAVEEVVEERTVEVARSLVADLELSHRALRTLDHDAIADRLAALMPLHRGIRHAELLVARGATLEVTQIAATPGGLEVTTDTQPGPLPAAQAASMAKEEDARVATAEIAILDAPRRPPLGLLRLVADVSYAEQIWERERTVFLWVTAASATLLAILFTLVLGPMLARPLSRLAEVMGRVESGALDAPRVPGADRSDEIGVVARGLDAMLSRVRNFNAELRSRIDEATADLARKNRALAELNDLLVAARRDLTAKERLAALGQLSGTIAHELGNPLNAMSGRVQLLARDPACPPEMRTELAGIEGEVRRMTAIIRRFLDSARALTPAPEPVDVGALVEEAVSLSLSADARARLRVERAVPAELGSAVTDPGLVRHVLTNFISNAVDAMPAGGTLTVRAERRGGQLALAVSDTGEGIAPEERRRIFEPFYSTKAPGRGTGLGLAICREIASALKGRIDVESEPGQGSTFTLVVPAPAWRAAG